MHGATRSAIAFNMKGIVALKLLKKLGGGRVPTVEIMREMDEELEAGVPDWVQAWIDAEGHRPWPKNQE